MGVLKDHWFSQKSFDIFECNDVFDRETICEVLVNGEWELFTEQITVGRPPLSYRFGDLVFVGTSDTRRYTKASEWFKNQAS